MKWDQVLSITRRQAFPCLSGFFPLFIAGCFLSTWGSGSIDLVLTQDWCLDLHTKVILLKIKSFNIPYLLGDPAISTTSTSSGQAPIDPGLLENKQMLSIQIDYYHRRVIPSWAFLEFCQSSSKSCTIYVLLYILVYQLYTSHNARSY